jgi:type IX secretion system PorP/SprF family membrane protein
MNSLYMFDKVLINPAFAGSSNWIVATLKRRDQTVGFGNHEKTQTLNLHSPIQKKHIGLGFKIVNTKMPVVSNLSIAGQLSYHLSFAGGKLSLGIEGGIYKRQIDYKKLVLSDASDAAIYPGTLSSTVPDLSLGLYYQKKQFYAGLSNYHLLKMRFEKSAGLTSEAHLFNHIYFNIGNVFQLKKKISFEPSLLIKHQPSSNTQIDVNAMFYYNDRIGTGVQYRSGDAVVSMIRINITESLRITYAYDISISKLKTYSRKAHEIMISYALKLPPPPVQKEIHPRYYF